MSQFFCEINCKADHIIQAIFRENKTNSKGSQLGFFCEITYFHVHVTSRKFCKIKFKARIFSIKFREINIFTIKYYYSVSTLETTIFREIILLVRVNFRQTFLSTWLTFNFQTLMGGNTCPLLPPKRVWKSKVN